MPPTRQNRDELLARVAELEDELKQRDDKVKQLNAELGESRELLDKMREHLHEETEVRQRWIETFDMQCREDGTWLFDPSQSDLWKSHGELLERHRKLLRDWNKFVSRYNARVAPREMGRPLAASAAQQADVLKQHKSGKSLRTIATATLLSLRTVRTIVDRTNGSGRASKRTNELRRREFDRLRAAAYRVRKANRDRLPKQISELQKTGDALLKAAKGLGR